MTRRRLVAALAIALAAFFAAPPPASAIVGGAYYAVQNATADFTTGWIKVTTSSVNRVRVFSSTGASQVKVRIQCRGMNDTVEPPYDCYQGGVINPGGGTAALPVGVAPYMNVPVTNYIRFNTRNDDGSGTYVSGNIFVVLETHI